MITKNAWQPKQEHIKNDREDTSSEAKLKQKKIEQREKKKMKMWRVIYWLTEAFIKINKRQILVTAFKKLVRASVKPQLESRAAALIHKWTCRERGNSSTPGSWV